MGLQDVGVGFVLLPEEVLEFIVAAFWGSGQVPVKSKSITYEAGRKEMGRESGVRTTQLESVEAASNCVRKSVISVKPPKDGGKGRNS